MVGGTFQKPIQLELEVVTGCSPRPIRRWPVVLPATQRHLRLIAFAPRTSTSSLRTRHGGNSSFGESRTVIAAHAPAGGHGAAAQGGLQRRCLSKEQRRPSCLSISSHLTIMNLRLQERPKSIFDLGPTGKACHPCAGVMLGFSSALPLASSTMVSKRKNRKNGRLEIHNIKNIYGYIWIKIHIHS